MITRIDFEKICHELNLSEASASHKHARLGWRQIECPFCTGNPGYHLGYNIERGYFNCWRCGWKSTVSVFRKLFNTNYYDALELIKRYEQIGRRTQILTNKKQVRNKSVILPVGSSQLNYAHTKYLLKRNFNPDILVKKWGIKGIGIAGGKFAQRIVIPIYFRHKLVSYQARVVCENIEPKYRNCKNTDEVVPMKSIVYGYDKVPSDAVVIVEGVTDVWRLGYGAVATFGTGFTAEQIRLLGESFVVRYILYDSDSAGKTAGYRLAKRLAMYPGTTEIVTVKKNSSVSCKDPAMFSEKDARFLMRRLIQNDTNKI